MNHTTTADKGELLPCPSLMTGIPTDVLQAAKIVGAYFKRRNIKTWKLLDIQSRAEPDTVFQQQNTLPLAEKKTQAIIERGYKITGYVLTHDDGRKAISDMQAVRWLEPGEFWKLMHPAQDNIEGKLGMVPEPFGYFRCTLDGWIDCAETDEGARPLYEYAEIAKRDAEIAWQKQLIEKMEHAAKHDAAKLAGVDGLVSLLKRYRNETPLGNQPHMIAHQVDAALATYEAAQGEKGVAL